MALRALPLFVGALGLLALGCLQPSPAPSPPTPGGMPPPPEAPSLKGTLLPAEVEGLAHPGARSALRDLARRLGVEPSALTILKAQEVTWRDSSLGCPEPGKAYLQVLTPGLRLVLGFQGREFVYHTSKRQALPCPPERRREPLEARPLPGLWARLSPMPTARSEVAAAVLDGRIYVFGGFGAGATATEEYDPRTDTWRRRAPIPQGVNHTAAVALGGKIYLIGGFEGFFRPIATVWAYDPRTDTWERRADLPTPRGALGAVALDGKVYAIGGRGIGGDTGAVEVYDPATDTWTARSPLPTPRDHLAIAVVEGRIHVIAGRAETFARNLSAHEVYNPETDTWERRADLPTPRSGIGAGVVKGRVYVVGGEEVGGTFDTVERYDPRTDTWETMPPMPTARHGLAVVALGGRLYTLAGGPRPGGSASAQNEVFIVLDGGGR